MRSFIHAFASKLRVDCSHACLQLLSKKRKMKPLIEGVCMCEFVNVCPYRRLISQITEPLSSCWTTAEITADSPETIQKTKKEISGSDQTCVLCS